MSQEYHVPTYRLPTELRISDSAPMDVDLFLGEHAERHKGRERPSDLLNGEKQFFPVETSYGGHLLIRKAAVLFLSVSTEDVLANDPGMKDLLDAGQETPREARRVKAAIRLEEDTRVTGEIIFFMPPGEQRLQDFLNLSPETFFRVWDGDRVHLVNGDRIVRIEVREDGDSESPPDD